MKKRPTRVVLRLGKCVARSLNSAFIVSAALIDALLVPNLKWRGNPIFLICVPIAANNFLGKPSLLA